MGLVAAELMVKIGCDTKDFDSNINKANQSTSTFGDTFKAIMSSNIITKVFDMAVQGAQKAAQAFVNFIKDVVQLYSEYEQLSGGAQKIFDEIDYEKIYGDAKNAYKELNMSMNDYLESINLVGATFTQTMGDEKAYEVARTGMIAISDYATGTGKSVDELNQKYQMITRSAGSYQSIADQFAGILPQTSADFLEAAQNAGYLSDSYTSLTQVPVAEYQEALTYMLADGVEQLGLTGNTAKEASKTVSGSIATVKAAWENLKIGLGDPNADLNELLDNLISSLEAAADNILPVVERALDGIADLIVKIAPKIEEEMPGLIEKLLPVIENVISELIDIAVTVLTDLMPEILDACQQLFDAFMETLEENTPILAGFIEIMRGMSVGLIEFFANLATSFVEFFGEIKEKIKEKLEEIKTWISEKWEEIKENARQKWEDIKTAISDKWEEIKTAVQEKVEAVRSFVTEKWETLKSNTREKWESIKSTVSDKLENLRTTAREKAESIRSSMSEKWSSILSNARDKWESIKSSIREKIDAIKNLFPLHIGDLFSNIRLPHFNWHWNQIVGPLKVPVFDGISWYAKAYDNPYLLNAATVFGNAGFGDRGNYNGGELVYGHDALMNDIREATSGEGGGDITINIYPRQDQSEEDIARAVQKQLVRWEKQKRSAFA